MITLSEAKELMIKHINKYVGVQVIPEGKMEQSIDAFLDFLKKKGISFVQELNSTESINKLLYEYRINLRIFSDDDAEEPLTNAAGAFLAMCVKEGWLEESLLDTWIRISPKEFFSNRYRNFNLN